MAETMKQTTNRGPLDTFVRRHIGSSDDELATMLQRVGYDSLDELCDNVVPGSIRLKRPLAIGEERGETELLEELRETVSANRLFRSYIGLGYHGCITPPVIQRNILENPAWYTQYTPYQAEISQGRLEALLNFQTMIGDLTGLPLANASLLDEGTAAAEAMAMCLSLAKGRKNNFFVAADCHPQTIAVLRTRAEALGVTLTVDRPAAFDPAAGDFCGMLLQLPDTRGRLVDPTASIAAAHEADVQVVIATDPLALTLMRSPGEMGADIAIGSTQRFGVPLGFGGPHAAFLSTHDRHRRLVPGRIVGVSKDAEGGLGFRLALQTREQHIRRDKATSNICTAQALLAIMSAMYAVYHGAAGLRAIAERVHASTRRLAVGLRKLGHDVGEGRFFDTLTVRCHAGCAEAVLGAAQTRKINLRAFDDGSVGVALDETVTEADLRDLLELFASPIGAAPELRDLDEEEVAGIDGEWARTSEYLTHPVFTRYHSEHEMLRYLHRLQARDLSLAHSMIPLGSCTMKLNGTSAMLPLSWPKISGLHPFAPVDQTRGYEKMFDQLAGWLCEITGFSAFSLQPNAGAQGEYAGLLVIRAYHRHRREEHRDVCLIPTSAHGTNPASAVMAGMRVVAVACDEKGNVDMADLQAKAKSHADRLAALMLTYPSTHGVFEEGVRDVCRIVHDHGGLVYMDGANMNAQVGLCRPGDIGADVCHLNLHKTFCIPHGGGGPGMGPIGVSEQLAPFLPGHPLRPTGGELAIGPVSAAPFGSSSILPISWVFIALMGGAGLRKSTQVAILNANYMASRLGEHFPLVYTGRNGLVAHEFIIDLRPFKQTAGIRVDDVAKRLIDYGIHAPTMSWPVVGTMMIEPTESESIRELDRFCDAMIQIRAEIREIEEGRADREDNVLRRAPHTAAVLTRDEWERPYSREKAAYPLPSMREYKFWPAVGRVDNTYGDRNLVCTCPPLEDYLED